MRQDALQAKRDDVLTKMLQHVERNDPLLILKAPPGSGKTHFTLRAVALAASLRRRIAVATQTNNQADEFCQRMATEFGRFPVHRWASGGRTERDLGPSVTWFTESKHLPEGPCIVVATSAKWSTSKLDEYDNFEELFIDEAWQMAWADFMLMSTVAGRFVLVGDPGQIPPVVPIDVSRWQTSRRPPHRPAPDVILRDKAPYTRSLELPVTTRLPHDTCELVQSFYDFSFDSWAGPGQRHLVLETAGGARVDPALDLLTSGSVALLTLPTPASGPPFEEDREVADLAAEVVRRLLERRASVMTENGPGSLEPRDIGVAATHRVMNSRISHALGDLVGPEGVRVDTAERWQGLERNVMVVVHPLSGVTKPSGFDLSTGRLCVMASRHRVGLVLVSRDHVGATLEAHLPVADQALGLPDESGRGRRDNLDVWRRLETEGRRVEVGR